MFSRFDAHIHTQGPKVIPHNYYPKHTIAVSSLQIVYILYYIVKSYYSFVFVVKLNKVRNTDEDLTLQFLHGIDNIFN